MTKPELLALFRTLADDAVAPYLVSDAQVNLWITEAEREGAERGLYLYTGAAHNISVIADTATYAINSAIILLKRAKLSGESSPLVKAMRCDLDANLSDWESKTGTPKLYVLENYNLTLYPKPDAAFTLTLDGSRRPASDMETPAYLHESLVYWLLHKFYSIADADINNQSLALQNLQTFTRMFGHKRSANFDTTLRNGVVSNPFLQSPFS
jgi:hypothetical protein